MKTTMEMTMNNPTPQPAADREADRLAELADCVRDLRKALKERWTKPIRDAANGVLVAMEKASIHEDYDFAIRCCITAIEEVMKWGSSSRDRKALLHVASAIENIVEEEASERN